MARLRNRLGNPARRERLRHDASAPSRINEQIPAEGVYPADVALGPADRAAQTNDPLQGPANEFVTNDLAKTPVSSTANGEVLHDKGVGPLVNLAERSRILRKSELNKCLIHPIRPYDSERNEIV